MRVRNGLADCGDLVNATPAVTRGPGSFGGLFWRTALVDLFKATLFRSCVEKYLSLTLYMDFSFARLAAWEIIWTRNLVVEEFVVNPLGVDSLIDCSLSYSDVIHKVTSTLQYGTYARSVEHGGTFVVPHLLWHGTSVFWGSSKQLFTTSNWYYNISTQRATVETFPNPESRIH